MQHLPESRGCSVTSGLLSPNKPRYAGHGGWSAPVSHLSLPPEHGQREHPKDEINALPQTSNPICFAIHSRPVCQDLVNQSSEREESGFHCFHAVFFLSFTPPFITATPPSCFLLLNTVLKPLCNPQLIFQARLRALPLGCRKISWQTG